MIPVTESGDETVVVTASAATVIARPLRTDECREVVTALQGKVILCGVCPYHRQAVTIALVHLGESVGTLRSELIDRSKRTVF